MSAPTPPLPLTIAELVDKRTKRLNRLVALLVTSLATNNPQGIFAAISAFVRYFTFLLETLEKLSNRKKEPSTPGIPFA
jgi:hypothetical protein